MIARFAGSGVTPANSARSRSNGYGCRRSRRGFTDACTGAGRAIIAMAVCERPPGQSLRDVAHIDERSRFPRIDAVARRRRDSRAWSRSRRLRPCSPTGDGAGSGPPPIHIPPAPVTDPAAALAVSPPFGAGSAASDACGSAERARRRHALARRARRARRQGSSAVPLSPTAARGWLPPASRCRAGATLVAVRPDGMTIRDAGGERTVALRATGRCTSRPSHASAQRAASAACALPPGFKGPVVKLNAELVQGLIAQPERCVRSPTRQDGALVIRDEAGFAAMLGMKKGDRVAQANGIALRAPDDVIVAVLRPLAASQPVRLTGSRRYRAARAADPQRERLPGLASRRQPVEHVQRAIRASRSRATVSCGSPVPDVALARDDRRHAGRDAGLHVAQVVADVHAARRRRRRSARAACSSGAGCGFGCGVVSPHTIVPARVRELQRAITTGSVKRAALLVTMPHASPRASSASSSRVDAVRTARRFRQARPRSAAGTRRAARGNSGSSRRDAHAGDQQSARAGRRVASARGDRHRRAGRAPRARG